MSASSMPRRFKLLGLDAERRPVILRLHAEGAALERVRQQIIGPRYIHSGWLAWAGVRCPPAPAAPAEGAE